MDKRQVASRIAEIGIVPVVRAASVDEAVAAVAAIAEGGVPVAEITTTVPGAAAAIARLRDELGDRVLVGAGTVLEASDAEACIAAGAQFVVSPAFDAGVADACRSRGVAFFPGALTPTEIVAAWRAGADAVKVFPCGAVGGASYLRALRAPLAGIALMPTGGVSLATAGDFVRAGAFALGVGSDLVDLDALRAGNAAALTATARAYVAAIHEARADMGALGRAS